MAWRNKLFFVILSVLLFTGVNKVGAGDDGTPESSKAIVIDPFNKEFSELSTYYVPPISLYNLYIQSIIYNLKQAGYSVDYYKDDNVTIDLLKRLDNEEYGVIYINTHGFMDQEKIVIFTGERRESEKEDLYKEDIESNRVGCFEHEGNLMGYFYVTPEFFEFYGNDSRYHNALVFVDSCFSGNNTSLADAFLKLGAGCFVGWTESISVEHGVEMDGLFFHTICSDNRTVEQSILKARPDPASGARLIYFGNGRLYLIETGKGGSSIGVTLLDILVVALSACIIFGVLQLVIFRRARRTSRSTSNPQMNIQ